MKVWSHFDGGNCLGQAVGVRVRLDNGIQGFIPTKMISDMRVSSPEERVKVSDRLHFGFSFIFIVRKLRLGGEVSLAPYYYCFYIFLVIKTRMPYTK